MGHRWKSGPSALVKHAPAPKAAGEVVGVVGMVEEEEEEVEVVGADTKIPVSYELRPW
jgi:hypothetical protein